MPSMSRTTIIGHVGKPPVLDQTGKGLDRLKFSVAVSRWSDKEHPNWFSVTVFGKDAIHFSDKITKGATVLVDGNFEAREWETGEGVTRTALEITANKIVLFSKAGDSQEKQAPPAKQQKTDKEPDLDDDDPYKEDF